jgi:hypothetical protein
MIVTPQGKPWPFSVELDTMEVERGHTRGHKYPGPGEAYPCGRESVFNRLSIAVK